jgi:lysophospholipase L1-like esterase
MIGTTPRTWNNGTSDYQSTPNRSGKYLADYVDAFHDVAKYYGIPFLDLLRTSGINVLNIDQYMSQQGSGNDSYYLHPTNDGYKYIGRLISAFIKSVG